MIDTDEDIRVNNDWFKSLKPTIYNKNLIFKFIHFNNNIKNEKTKDKKWNTKIKTKIKNKK